MDWARSRDFPVLRLLVTETNDAAVRLYDAVRIHRMQGERLPLREGSDMITMSMTLDLST